MRFPLHKYVWSFEEFEDAPLKRNRVTFAGWLGSGVLDCNGKEIFEGDIVRFSDGDTYSVVFTDGCFRIDNAVEGTPLCELLLNLLEVVGHIAEEQNHED